MSGIKVNTISEYEVEVLLDNDVPLEMVETLNKGLEDRGLYQDTSRSSLGKRCYTRRAPSDVDSIHEELFKSIKRKFNVGPNIERGWAIQRQNRLNRRNEQREANKMPPINMNQMMNPTTAPKPDPVVPAAPRPQGPTTLNTPNRLHDSSMVGAHYSNDPNKAKKNEDGPDVHGEKCTCDKCKAARKTDLNKSLRERLTGNKWGQHNPFPSAHQPNANKPLPTAEQLMADQLANVMMAKKMMQPIPGAPLLGSVAPPQPTDDQLFGHLVPNEQMLKAADRQYSNGMNDFFSEAMKPISSRFSSEEEELQFWANLKVSEGAGSVE